MTFRVLLAVFIAAFSLQPFYAQLSGSAFLSGQSSHAGIQVKFIAQQAPGATDSCYTNAAGSFSIHLAGGSYKIRYQYPGHQTHFYNSSFAVTITNTTVLNPVTLIPGTAVYVSGPQSGRWANTRTYYVNGNITVLKDSTLTIQEGTVIKFLGNFGMFISGVLDARGTASSRIVFTSHDPFHSEWDMIYLNEGNSRIDYCTIEHNFKGIVAKGKSPVISNNILRYNSFMAIELYEGAIEVSNNEIRQLGFSGICTNYNSTATLSCNHIYNDSIPPFGSFTKGIVTATSNLVVGNHIHNLKQGISISGYGNPVIKNNFIHDNDYGIGIDHFNTPDSTILITNNTLLDNRNFSVFGFNFPPATKLINNIIAKSDTAIYSNSSLVCDHNLFFDCLTNFSALLPASGLGSITGTNVNGDPADVYANIFKDPVFIPNKAPVLQSGSPAFNAGNSSYGSHIGGDSYSGCFTSLFTGLSSFKTRSDVFRIYPNPGKGVFYLELSADSRVLIYDVLNKLVADEWLPIGIRQIDLNEAPAGLYFICVQAAGQKQTAKFIKQ